MEVTSNTVAALHGRERTWNKLLLQKLTYLDKNHRVKYTFYSSFWKVACQIH